MTRDRPNHLVNRPELDRARDDRTGARDPRAFSRASSPDFRLTTRLRAAVRAVQLIFFWVHPPPSGADADRPTILRHHSDMTRFGKVVKLKGFKPFTSAAMALDEINNVAESTCSDDLKNFLELNLPKVKDAKKARSSETKLGRRARPLGRSCVRVVHVRCRQDVFRSGL